MSRSTLVVAAEPIGPLDDERLVLARLGLPPLADDDEIEEDARV